MKLDEIAVRVERSEFIHVRFLESTDRVPACELARLVLARVRDVQRHRATLAERLPKQHRLVARLRERLIREKAPDER